MSTHTKTGGDTQPASLTMSDCITFVIDSKHNDPLLTIDNSGRLIWHEPELLDNSNVPQAAHDFVSHMQSNLDSLIDKQGFMKRIYENLINLCESKGGVITINDLKEEWRHREMFEKLQGKKI